MARWRGIFRRRGERDGEHEASAAGTDALDDPETALYPGPAGRGADEDRSSTDDWEQGPQPPAGDREEVPGDGERRSF